MSTIILIAVAYILGSVPNALWIGKVFKGIDIREHGSKNTVLQMLQEFWEQSWEY